MSRTSTIAIVVLALLCVGLAVNTVVQATSSARPAQPGEPVEPVLAHDVLHQTEAVPLGDVAFEEINTPTDAAPLGFVGEWVNQDDVGSLSRITISKTDSGFAIQPWSADERGEEPYGEAREFDCASNPAEIEWDAGFAQQRMRLAVMPDGLLRVDRLAECVNHQCGIPHETTTEYFAKATPAQLAAHAAAVGELVAEAEVECLPVVPGGG